MADFAARDLHKKKGYKPIESSRNSHLKKPPTIKHKQTSKIRTKKFKFCRANFRVQRKFASFGQIGQFVSNTRSLIGVLSVKQEKTNKIRAIKQTLYRKKFESITFEHVCGEHAHHGKGNDGSENRRMTSHDNWGAVTTAEGYAPAEGIFHPEHDVVKLMEPELVKAFNDEGEVEQRFEREVKYSLKGEWW